MSDEFSTVLSWADEIRRLGVRANADTPEDAQKAHQFGAEGIGLCRTEHMFMAADRQPKMRAMIMADDEEARRAALEELLPLQQQDFEGLFEEMRGLPVTIRLLDPPLHEFLPNAEDRAGRGASAGVEATSCTTCSSCSSASTPSRSRTRCSAPAVSGWGSCTRRSTRCRCGRSSGPRWPCATGPGGAHVEIMIPLVAYERELDLMRELVERVAEEEVPEGLRWSMGTMMELPRAYFAADKIATSADFFSFGTNDLTQTALGLSRDDIGGDFLDTYMDAKIIDRSPFDTIDRPGVGWLVRLAAWNGRTEKPELGLGICGEHGGDDSIEFFEIAKLDYVSCSPYRVPIARVAAQAAIEH